MKDVEVRLACLQLAMCDEVMSDKLAYAQDLYDWVAECNNEVSDDIKDWSDGFDQGYDAGYNTALEAALVVLNDPETNEVEDAFDRGYLNGVESVVEALNENNPAKEAE